MSAKRPTPGRITNRRAKFDYELGDSLVVGLQLTGAETKALRLGHGQLRGAYVASKGSELWLVGAQINSTQGVKVADELRSRKLLAKRREIDQLLGMRHSGSTIVPLEILTGGRYIKLRIAPGRGKRKYDKRETLRRRQQEREARKATE